MAGESGASEVYQGRGGTGAAYITDAPQEDPLNIFRQSLARMDQRKKEMDAQKQHQMEEANKDIDYKGVWDTDIPGIAKQYQEYKGNLARAYQEWSAKGQKADLDPANPASKVWLGLQQQKDQLHQAIDYSKQQAGYYDEANKKMLGAPEGKFTNRLEEYRNMSPMDRSKFDRSQLVMENYDIEAAKKAHDKEIAALDQQEVPGAITPDAQGFYEAPKLKTISELDKYAAADHFFSDPRNIKPYVEKYKNASPEMQNKWNAAATQANDMAQKAGKQPAFTPLTMMRYDEVSPLFKRDDKEIGYHTKPKYEWEQGVSTKYNFTWNEQEPYTQNMSTDPNKPDVKEYTTPAVLHIQPKNPSQIINMEVEPSNMYDKNLSALSTNKNQGGRGKQTGPINVSPENIKLMAVTKTGLKFHGNIEDLKKEGNRIEYKWFVSAARNSTQPKTADLGDGKPIQLLGEEKTNEQVLIPYDEIKASMEAKFGLKASDMEAKKQEILKKQGLYGKPVSGAFKASAPAGKKKSTGVFK